MDQLLIPELAPFSCAGIVVLLLAGLLALTGHDGGGKDVGGKDVDFGGGHHVPGDLNGDGIPDVPVFIETAILWFGLGKVPLSVFIACVLASFSVTGLAMQSLVMNIFGGPMPVWLAVPLALLVTAPLSRLLCSGVAAIIPRHSSIGIHLSELAGEIADLTLPCMPGGVGEARVKDRHGNEHSVLVVPASGQPARIEAGTPVLLQHHLPDGKFAVVALAAMAARAEVAARMSN